MAERSFVHEVVTMVPDGDFFEGGRPDLPTIPSRFIADPREFSEYVLVPGEKSGKDGVFYRPFGFSRQE